MVDIVFPVRGDNHSNSEILARIPSWQREDMDLLLCFRRLRAELGAGPGCDAAFGFASLICPNRLPINSIVLPNDEEEWVVVSYPRSLWGCLSQGWRQWRQQRAR
jgi:hypothetical protein